jgi:hypothetical protein
MMGRLRTEGLGALEWACGGATGCLTKSYGRNSSKRVIPNFCVHRVMIEFNGPMVSRVRRKKGNKRHRRNPQVGQKDD